MEWLVRLTHQLGSMVLHTSLKEHDSKFYVRDFPGGPVANSSSTAAPNAGGLGSIPSQGTRAHKPWQKSKIWSAKTKT